MKLPGATSSPDDILSAGEVFGRYCIVRRLGRGGMGEVYEATHATLGKRVALKVLRPEVAHDARVLARFQREGAAIARVAHPNVVDIFDVGVERDVAFLVMEFLEGEDLGVLLRREGALEVSRTVDILLPVLAAVAAAHAEGVIHRDLKPANVFLATTRLGVVTPKVLDFGVSKILDGPSVQNITGPSTLLGTPYYLPPELARGARNADARSDQYALGVILYQCLTDCRPFAGATLYDTLHAIVHGVYEPVEKLRPELPREITEAVTRALSREPEARFESVLEFGSALIPFASSGVRALWGKVFGLTAEVFAEVSTRPEIATHLFEPAEATAEAGLGATTSTPPPESATPAPRELSTDALSDAVVKPVQTTVTSIAPRPRSARITTILGVLSVLFLLAATGVLLLAVRRTNDARASVRAPKPASAVREASAARDVLVVTEAPVVQRLPVPREEPAVTNTLPQATQRAPAQRAVTRGASARTARQRSEPRRVAVPMSANGAPILR